jgi:hypothetical protein
VDATRKAERAESAELGERLKGQRYTSLRNPETMTDEQRGSSWSRRNGPSRSRRLERTYYLKLVFQEVFTQPARMVAGYLTQWCE